MSSLTTSIGVLALAVLGMAGWQASKSNVVAPTEITTPSEISIAVALPGLPALPARLTAEPARTSIVLPPELGSNGLPCGMQLTATAEPPALVALQIRNACAPGQVVLLHHADLEIALLTDAQGEATLHLPALSHPARIDIVEADGTSHALTVDVPDLVAYHRISLAWSGGADLALHAHERGATDGAPGHIHPAARMQPQRAVLGEGGFLALLGTAPDGPRAQVYTFPRDAIGDAGLVRFSLALTDGCDADIAARRSETRPDGRRSVAELQITTDACSAAAPQTLLQNLFQDLRIAAR